MRLLLLDGLNLIRRIHAAVPAHPDARQTGDGLIESCTRSVQRALLEARPTHALCVFDAPGQSWRHALLPGYKASRPAMPDALADELPRIERAIEDLGVRPVRAAGFEADDVIASIALRAAARGGEVLILSTDKSMLSLLRPGIRVRNHFQNQELDAAYVEARFGVAPAQLPTWLALVGERSVGVPGVRSIGAKTASRLVAAHGTLDGILAAAATMSDRVGAALRSGEADARLSLSLAELRTDVELGLNLQQCRVPPRVDPQP